MPPTGRALHLRTTPATAGHFETGCNERRLPGISVMKRRDTLASKARLDAVRRGEESALRDIIREYSSLVYGISLSTTRSEADAEDILQEIFVGLPEALHRFDGRNFAGWLTVMTKRRALMVVRAQHRRDELEVQPGPSPAEPSEDRSLARVAIERALSGLPDLLRDVFLLKEVHGLSHREIADAMGITESASQIRLYRARRALRKALDR